MRAKEQPSLRRGDLVRLSDGQIVRVVSRRDGYIHTTAGTYAPWQIERLDNPPSCCGVDTAASAAPSSR
jgi:hypothetical protein